MKRVILVCVAGLAMASVARADDQPWAVGVSDAQKQQAQDKLAEGNALFLKRDYKTALDKYREAIAVWDHPAIRFNIVRCLIQLDQPVEAADNLEAALKYGAAPLDEAVFNEAQSYKKLFATQIGNLDITCEQEGAKVSLDGKVVIEKCPGKISRRVRSGSYQVVGEMAGFLTTTDRVKVVGGEHEVAAVKLVPLAKAAKLVRRWPTWEPWLVFGGGLGVLGVGVAFNIIAKGGMADYDSEVALVCGTSGCPAGDPRLQGKSKAEAEATASYVMISAGAAAVIAGGIMLYVNRAHTVYEKPPVEVTPMPGGAAMSFSGSF